MTEISKPVVKAASDFVERHTFMDTLREPIYNGYKDRPLEEISAETARNYNCVKADYDNKKHHECIGEAGTEMYDKSEPTDADPQRTVRRTRYVKGTNVYQSKILGIYFSHTAFSMLLCLQCHDSAIRLASSDSVYLLATGARPDALAVKKVVIEQFRSGMKMIFKMLMTQLRCDRFSEEAVEADRNNETTRFPEPVLSTLKISWQSLINYLTTRFDDDKHRNHITLSPSLLVHFTDFGVNALNGAQMKGLPVLLHECRAQNVPPMDLDFFVLLAFTPIFAAVHHFIASEHFLTGGTYAKWVFDCFEHLSLWKWNTDAKDSHKVRRIMKPLEAAVQGYFDAFQSYIHSLDSYSETRLRQANSTFRMAIVEVWRNYRPGLWRNPTEKSNVDWKWYEKITEDDLIAPWRNKDRQLPIWLADRIKEDALAQHPDLKYEREQRNYKLAPVIQGTD